MVYVSVQGTYPYKVKEYRAIGLGFYGFASFNVRFRKCAVFVRAVRESCKY